MFKKIAIIIALILPILAPSFIIGSTLFARHGADIYRVKIIGYDPRDMLYGHYLRYRFESEAVSELAVSSEIKTKIKRLSNRYYIPEEQSKHLDIILRARGLGSVAQRNGDEKIKYDMRIGVGITARGAVFVEKLYINGQTMESYLDSR